MSIRFKTTILVVFLFLVFALPTGWYINNHLAELQEATSGKQEQVENVDFDSLGGVSYKIKNGTMIIKPSSGKYGKIDSTTIKKDKSTAIWSDEIKNVTKIKVADGYVVYLDEDATALFYNFIYTTDIDLSGFNTSHCTNMSNMFSGCADLENLNLTGWTTTATTNTESMFAGCPKLKSITCDNDKINTAFKTK